MITVTGALAFASAVFIITAKPGPGMLAIVSRSLSSGWLQGSIMGLGICSIHVLYLIVAGFTFNLATELADFLIILLKTLGAVLMIYLGIKEYMKLNKPLVVEITKATRGESLKNFFSGMILALSNPIVVLFYVAFVPTILDVAQLRTMDIVICALLLLVSNWGLLVFISACADGVRGYLADTKNAKRLRILISIMFIMIGFVIGLSAMPFVDWGGLYLQK